MCFERESAFAPDQNTYTITDRTQIEGDTHWIYDTRTRLTTAPNATNHSDSNSQNMPLNKMKTKKKSQSHRSIYLQCKCVRAAGNKQGIQSKWNGSLLFHCIFSSGSNLVIIVKDHWHTRLTLALERALVLTRTRSRSYAQLSSFHFIRNVSAAIACSDNGIAKNLSLLSLALRNANESAFLFTCAQLRLTVCRPI